jgi:hypothetical protein
MGNQYRVIEERITTLIKRRDELNNQIGALERVLDTWKSDETQVQLQVAATQLDAHGMDRACEEGAVHFSKQIQREFTNRELAQWIGNHYKLQVPVSKLRHSMDRLTEAGVFTKIKEGKGRRAATFVYNDGQPHPHSQPQALPQAQPQPQPAPAPVVSKKPTLWDQSMPVPHTWSEKTVRV